MMQVPGRSTRESSCRRSSTATPVPTYVLVPNVTEAIDIPVLLTGGARDGRGLPALTGHAQHPIIEVMDNSVVVVRAVRTTVGRRNGGLVRGSSGPAARRRAACGPGRAGSGRGRPGHRRDRH